MKKKEVKKTKKKETKKKVKEDVEIVDKKILKKELKLAKRDLLILGFVGVLIVVAVFALTHKPIPVAEPGDIVKIHYLGTLENGTIIGNQTITFKVGAGEVIPGMDKAVVGMAVGAKKHIFIPYEDAYGAYNPRLVFAESRFRTRNRTHTLSFVKLNKTTTDEIKVGKVIKTEFLPWKILIKSINGSNMTTANVTFEEEPVLYSLYSDPLLLPWIINVTKINSTTIEYENMPRVGESIYNPYIRHTGKVIGISDDKIYIDFNHELAGKNLIFDIEMLEINKTSNAKQLENFSN